MRVIVNKETIALHWLSCFQERKGSLIFLLGSAIIPGPESFPFCFIYFFFTFTPFDQDLSLKESLIKS